MQDSADRLSACQLAVCLAGSLVSKHLLPRIKASDLFVASTRRQIGAKARSTPEDPADRVHSKGPDAQSRVNSTVDLSITA